MSQSMMRQITGKCVMVVALFCAITSAKAVPIVIQNAGFENPRVDEGIGLTISGTPIDFWTTPDNFGGGLWDINNFPYASWNQLSPEGTQVIYVGAFRGPNYYEQTLSHIIQPNSTYTLTGFVGDPIGFPTPYAVDLRVGENVLASKAGPGLEGSFESFQIVFDSTGSAYVGFPLTIRLYSEGTQTAFDDLKLDGPASPVVAGDYDGNQVVDGADFLWWQRVSGLSVDINGTGADGNGDGLVDGLDLMTWQNRFGASAATIVATVPEPTTLAIIVIAGLPLIRRLRDTVSADVHSTDRR